MGEWKTYRLGEICDVRDGTHDSPKQSLTGKPLVTSKNIKGGIINLSSTYLISNEDYQSINKRSCVHQWDILFSMIGTVGELAIVKNEPQFAIKNIGLFKMNGDQLLSYWIYYYLHSDNAQENILKNIKGSTQQYIALKDLRLLPIGLPPIEIRQRIVEILKSLDDKIELNRRINANLEAQAQALFRSWFVDNETQNNNPGFFNDIIQTTLSGDWGQETPKGNYISEVYCIRGADIPDIKCGDKGKLPTRYILEKNLRNKKLSENDLVVEISGGSPTQSTGRICLITRALLDRMGKDVICTNFCRALKPIPDYSFFIYLYWQYLYNNNTMFSYENGTTGIKNLNITDFINKEPIIIPEKKKILEFNKVLQPIFDMIYKNGRENKRLSALRDTLLPKLMAGNIRF